MLYRGRTERLGLDFGVCQDAGIPIPLQIMSMFETCFPRIVRFPPNKVQKIVLVKNTTRGKTDMPR
jgi:hypothetical protein